MRREYDFARARRGPVVAVPKGKTRITIRLDDDIVAWFKTQVNDSRGGNFQALMNAVLREYKAQWQESLEQKLRKVIREELGR